jgi:hypothetical protein
VFRPVFGPVFGPVFRPVFGLVFRPVRAATGAGGRCWPLLPLSYLPSASDQVGRAQRALAV